MLMTSTKRRKNKEESKKGIVDMREESKGRKEKGGEMGVNLLKIANQDMNFGSFVNMCSDTNYICYIVYTLQSL